MEDLPVSLRPMIRIFLVLYSPIMVRRFVSIVRKEDLRSWISGLKRGNFEGRRDVFIKECIVR